uniref:Uncharacterized protein n=1 Tax=Anguilla anguilla TaxID=7936 RepID=A0A0E9TM37_ANGAN
MRKPGSYLSRICLARSKVGLGC